MASHAAGTQLRLQVAHYGGASTEIAVTLGGAPAAAKTAATTAPAAPAAGTKQARPDLTWTRYTDPVEHAFTIDVPQGWRVSGGTRRMSAVDIRLGVEAVSPDGLITLFYGDADVPIFTVPSDMLEMAGCIPA